MRNVLTYHTVSVVDLPNHPKYSGYPELLTTLHVKKCETSK